MARSYWLVKSEPETYSIQDFERDGKTGWEGVRNYQARNHLRAMKKGDRVLFYHSNAEPSGAVGVASVAREAYDDPTALDKKSEYYEPRATKEDAVWSTVDLAHEETLPRLVSLAELKKAPALKELALVKKGNRLSVLPLQEKEFDAIVALSKTPAPPVEKPKKPAAKKRAPKK